MACVCFRGLKFHSSVTQQTTHTQWLTRSRWMKLCVSRYSIPSQTSWHMERSQGSLRVLPLCRRKFNRQPFSMNSATISRGRCCRQTPYSCTSFGWHSLLRETTNTVSLPCADKQKDVNTLFLVSFFPSDPPSTLPPSFCPSLHHNLGLLYEVLLTHGSFSNGLDGHFLLSPPFAELHQTKLTAAQLLHEGQLIGVNLPLLWKEGTKQKEEKEGERVKKGGRAI